MMKKKIIALVMVAALMVPSTAYAADIEEQDGIVAITGAEDGYSYTASVTVTVVVPEEGTAVGGSVTGNRWISMPATVVEETPETPETLASTISNFWDKVATAITTFFS